MKSWILICVVCCLPGWALFAVEEPIDPPKQVEMQWDENDDQNFLATGEVPRDHILRFKVYNFNYVEYAPKADPVELIHNAGPAEIKVFFGDWCKDSKKQVPAFIKTMEFADNRNILVSFINVSRDKTIPEDAKSMWNVDLLPTFIILKDGKEAGRIVETPKNTIEEDLVLILNAQ